MAFACLVCLTVSVEAFDVELSLDALSEATAIGQTGIESRRADFHRPYRLVISQPPLDYIDVVTPFRRVVLAADITRVFVDEPHGVNVTAPRIQWSVYKSPGISTIGRFGHTAR